MKLLPARTPSILCNHSESETESFRTRITIYCNGEFAYYLLITLLYSLVNQPMSKRFELMICSKLQ